MFEDGGQNPKRFRSSQWLTGVGDEDQKKYPMDNTYFQMDNWKEDTRLNFAFFRVHPKSLEGPGTQTH